MLFPVVWETAFISKQRSSLAYSSVFQYMFKCKTSIPLPWPVLREVGRKKVQESFSLDGVIVR